MSDGIDKAHADAVLALLAAGLDTHVSVFDGQVPDPTPDVASKPWVLVYFQPTWPTDGAGNSLDGQSQTCRLRIYTHSIGATAAAARSVGGQARAALLNARPAVTGRICGLIRWVDGNPPDRDETLGTLVMDKVDVWEFVTTPG
jgi:hypothetical protein